MKAKCPICKRKAKVNPSSQRFAYHKNGKGGTCLGWGEKVPAANTEKGK